MYARDPRRTEYWGLTLRVSGLCLRHFDAKRHSPSFAEHSAGRHSQRGEVFDRCSCTDAFFCTAARHHAHTGDGRSQLCSSQPSETAASLDCHCNSWCWAGVTYCRRALCAGLTCGHHVRAPRRFSACVRADIMMIYAVLTS